MSSDLIPKTAEAPTQKQVHPGYDNNPYMAHPGDQSIRRQHLAELSQGEVRRYQIDGPIKPFVERLLASSRTVKSWHNSRQPGGQRTAVYHMAAYLMWRESRGMSTDPDSWIDECQHGNNLTLITHLQSLKDWVEGASLDGKDPQTRRKYYTDIRGFYAHHMVSLPASRLAMRRNETRVLNRVTAIEFLEMTEKVLRSKISVRDQSIILTMLQGGMDASTLAKSFNYVAFPQLVEHFETDDWTKWDETKVPVQLNLVRPKTDYLFYTFVDRDGIALLKSWLSYRTSIYGRIKIKRSPNPQYRSISDPIYLTDYGAPMTAEYTSRIFHDLGVLAGVNMAPEEKLPRFKGAMRRYPFHSHECRDTLVTLGRRVGVDLAVVNFFVGHNIDKYGYDKSPWDDPDFFEREYSKLGQYLNVISGRETAIKADVERRYEEQLREMQSQRDADTKILQQVLAEFAVLKGKLSDPSIST